MREKRKMTELKKTRVEVQDVSKKYRIPKRTQTRNARTPKNKIGCPVCGDTEHIQVTGRCVSCGSCGWNGCSL